MVRYRKVDEMRCDEMGVLSFGVEWEEDDPAELFLARKRMGKGTWYINAIRCRLLPYLHHCPRALPPTARFLGVSFNFEAAMSQSLPALLDSGSYISFLGNTHS